MRLAHGPIPPERTIAGCHHVADPGEAEEGGKITAEGHTEPGNLHEAAGQERGLGIVPEPKSVTDPRRDSRRFARAPASSTPIKSGFV